MHKFGFNIRTRTGHKVDNIVIMARDFDEAERRLRQMYTQCEIVNLLESSVEARRHPADIDSVGLNARHSPAPSTHKPGTQ